MLQHTKKSPYIIGCFSRPPHHPPPHPPKQGTSPLKTTPLSPWWGLHLGSVASTSGGGFFSPKGRLRMPSVTNSVTASWPWVPSLEASLVPLASVAWMHHPWMDGWMAPAGVGMGWLQPEFDGIYHHPLPRNKLRKLIVSRERESWKHFFLGVGGVF